MSDHDDGMPHSHLSVMLSAGGYLLVAATCTLAGYEVGHPHARGFTGVPWHRFLMFFAVLLPAYINRATLYEQAHRRFLDDASGGPRWQRRDSIAVPVMALIVAACVTLWSRPWTICDGLRALLALAPIYLLAVYATARWPKDRDLYDFRFRSFFPAFATCLPPFVFGFGDCADWILSASATVLVLGFWCLALIMSESKFARWSFATLLLLFSGATLETIHSPTQTGRWLQGAFFGVLLTLAVGVSESLRVTTRILHDREYRPGGVYPDEEKNFYLGGTNLATAIFLTSFPLTFLLPATTRAYLMLVGLLLCTQYLMWFCDPNQLKSPLWTKLGVIFGLALPSIVAIGADLSQAARNSTNVIPTVGLSEALAIATVSVVISIWLTKTFLWDMHKQRHLKYYVERRRCVAVTGITAGAGALMLGITSAIVRTSGNLVATQTDTRILILVWLYLFTLVACSLALLILRIFGRPTNLKDDDIDSGNIPPRGLPRAMLASTRPASSTAAGLLCALALLTATHQIGQALLAGMSVLLVTMFGFVLNDVLDVDKDRAAKVTRPIATGALSLPSAICVAVLLLLGGMACGGFLPYAWFLAIIAAALVAYTPFARAVPVAKGLFTALLCITPLRYASLIGSFRFPIAGYITLGCFVLGREALMDGLEARGDARAGMRTIAVRLGAKRTATIGRIVMCLVSAALCVLATSPVAIIFAVSALCLIVVASSLNLSCDREIALSRYAMILAAGTLGFMA